MSLIYARAVAMALADRRPYRQGNHHTIWNMCQLRSFRRAGTEAALPM